ncbi:MAG: hypothetical protein GXN91_01740, partial [Epsilonproteobacteria bacterium]|nr:hypothetical protein [Campylobacterota bacterium]
MRRVLLFILWLAFSTLAHSVDIEVVKKINGQIVEDEPLEIEVGVLAEESIE